MGSNLPPLEVLKANAHLEEAILKLRFLNFVNNKDDTSSELAGFEINKLLKEQARLEKEYAELLRQRALLKGITNKSKADEVQKKIEGTARDLKESTKKLCRMFRENPDLASDAEKIRFERLTLIEDLEHLIGLLNSAQLRNYLARMLSNLYDQDTFRSLNLEEKKITENIKMLKEKKKTKVAEFAHELEDRDKQIQSLKEDYLRAKNESEIASKYEGKVLRADENTKYRQYKQEIANLQHEKTLLEERKRVEEEVNQRTCDFLNAKNEKSRQTIIESNNKKDKAIADLENHIAKVKEDQASTLAKLNELNELIQNEEEDINRRRKDEEENEAKKERERIEKERMFEAVSIVQRQFASWADTNLVKKPTKPKSPKGGKKGR
eukprot:TRINITY_DN10048_c0_g3_i1.p2 TRINITY_DN10048_c0_g3~~TRINITY_DN10048_c0_g3_i1.p2  ORF type:complete len:381 (-),score=148.21 TRINITY_DN10048_c0_g3_i1:1825-2967(-)